MKSIVFLVVITLLLSCKSDDSVQNNGVENHSILPLPNHVWENDALAIKGTYNKNPSLLNSNATYIDLVVLDKKKKWKKNDLFYSLEDKIQLVINNKVFQPDSYYYEPMGLGEGHHKMLISFDIPIDSAKIGALHIIGLDGSEEVIIVPS